jgi:hypothetical protein
MQTKFIDVAKGYGRIIGWVTFAMLLIAGLAPFAALLWWWLKLVFRLIAE